MVSTQKTFALTVIVLALVLTSHAYIEASGDEITMCVKKSGLVYVIGEDFRRTDCRSKDTLLSWHVVGPQGPKGDKGDQGEPGSDGVAGAGNIAFIDAHFILTTSGVYYSDNSGLFQIAATVPPVPILVSDILQIDEDRHFLDKEGNYWRRSGNTWINIGHP